MDSGIEGDVSKYGKYTAFFFFFFFLFLFSVSENLLVLSCPNK